MDKKLLGAELCGTVEICRTDRFIGTQNKRVLDTRLESGVDYILGAQDVSLYGFKRVVLASRHLFQRCSMDNNGDPVHGPH